MQIQKFRNLIREEISKVLKEDFEELERVHADVMSRHAKTLQFLSKYSFKKLYGPRFTKQITRDKDQFVDLAIAQLGLKPTLDGLGGVSKGGSWTLYAERDTAPFSTMISLKVYGNDKQSIEKAFTELQTVTK